MVCGKVLREVVASLKVWVSIGEIPSNERKCNLVCSAEYVMGEEVEQRRTQLWLVA